MVQGRKRTDTDAITEGKETCNMEGKPCYFSKTRIGFLPEDYVLCRVYTVQYTVYRREQKVQESQS